MTAVAPARGSAITTPAPAEVIVASRRVVAILLTAAVSVAVLFAMAAPVVLGGDDALFTLPVLVHGALLCVAIACTRSLRTGLRVDSFALFLAWETLRGCIAPVILMYVGAGSRFYYRLGTPSDSRSVLFLGSVFFVVVVATRVALAAGIRRRADRPGGADGRLSARFDSAPSLPVNMPLTVGRVTAWPLITLGSVGLVLRFPTPSAIAMFFSGSIEGLQGNGQYSDGPLLLAANFLRPLLVLGLVMLIRSRRERGRRWWPLLPVTAVAALLALASYGLNRGTVAYCIIAITLVYFEKSDLRLRLRGALTTVSVLGLFFTLIGQLRSTIWRPRTGLDSTGLDLVSVLQSVLPYSATPDQLSAALPAVRQADPFGWRSFTMSLLSPIPGAPEAARTQSGTAVFNNVIYHSFIGKDQLLPSWFEGWISFGTIGLIAVGIAVGVLLAAADAMRHRAQSEIGAYASTIFALWIPQASVNAIGVVEQNVIYFVLTPLAVTTFARLWPDRHAGFGPLRHTEAPPRPTDTLRKVPS